MDLHILLSHMARGYLANANVLIHTTLWGWRCCFPFADGILRTEEHSDLVAVLWRFLNTGSDSKRKLNLLNCFLLLNYEHSFSSSSSFSLAINYNSTAVHGSRFL